MPEIDIIWWIVASIIFFAVVTLLSPQMMWLQARAGLTQMKKAVVELDNMAKESRRIALKAIIKHGKPKQDVEKEFNDFLDFFAIEPVSEDPVGVLKRLEHILDVRDKRFKDAIARLAPNADPETAANLEMAMEGAMANYTLYRLVRHFLVLAEKTKNIQIVMLVQMNIPFLRTYAKAFVDATKAFVEGKPIGDGVGPLTVVKLVKEAKFLEPVEDTVYTETEFEGRKLIIVKAKGPGGRVGKPGELIARLAKKRKVARIIMIDAAGKLEGEASGDVVEGVGAAIGGPPTEKYKIEEIAVKRKIPVDAIVIKESYTESLKPLNKKLVKGVDEAVERVKNAIRQRTKPGDTVIVAGIGNTIGIGQSVKELPAEFPAPPEEKKDEIESTYLPVR
ncbi:MAG: hypothetical protein APZ16_03275 [Candidatus Hadarchaeum yellowstonense]|jgi:hypothetical protein|uniref:DUF1512 domain-containing protein n=1 Tax=Hadarchaeum yellowstonense TaxID=1776334 RepID=A0A147JT48_HADYE|nr:MAG: hypothetical protein APZ16_03275 [Candidatus Hadarchaeum yellowstonense]